MTSGVEWPSTILTSCQTHSVRCSLIVLPCCHCSANQTNAECCFAFTAGGGYQPLRAAIECFLGLSGSAYPPPTGGGGGLDPHPPPP